MKTNIELANELGKLLFASNNFMTTVKVMSWHMSNNKNGNESEKVKSAFYFVVQPEFDRLSEHDLSENTKNIIIEMTYEKHGAILKEVLLGI
jgi:hypothetical protein